MTLEYTMDQLTFPSLEVLYTFTFKNQELLDSWEDKRMTGFKLDWFVQDRNKTRLTEIKSDEPLKWEPEAAIPKFQELNLVRMVRLVAKARVDNITTATILNTAFELKATMVLNRNLINTTTMCLNGQILKEYYAQIFDGINIGLNNDTKDIILTKADVNTGVMIFSIMTHCPTTAMQMTQFLHSLLSTQSARTVIQSTVNTIQLSSIKETLIKKGLNAFYLALDKIFHFQLVKILLATTSLSQLQTMMSKEWPYFTNYSQEIDQCLGGTSCQGVMDIVKTLGEYIVL